MSDVDEIAARVASAQKGDEAALAWLIEASQPRLLRFCVYLTGDRAQGEDLCQDVFVKALSALKSLNEGRAFVGWLMTSARHLYLDQRRSPKNRPHAVVDERMADESARQGDFLAVQKGLSALNKEDRHLLLLVDLEEHSYEEAGRLLGLSESAVRSRIHRARRAFAEKIEKG